MARRAKPGNSKPASRIDAPAEGEEHSFEFSSLPHIADFIEHGQIIVGIMQPAGCVAIAAEGRHSLAMLRRQKDESFAQLLTRLDLAIARAMADDIFTDEVNTPSK